MERMKINDGTVWPDPTGENFRDLSWRLRYDQDSITKGDKFNAASIIESYSYLLNTPGFRMKDAIKKLRGLRNTVKIKRIP